jgi:hypothetical protein
MKLLPYEPALTRIQREKKFKEISDLDFKTAEETVDQTNGLHSVREGSRFKRMSPLKGAFLIRSFSLQIFQSF